MTLTRPIELEKFLARFFGEGNDLKREVLDNSPTPMAQCARLWLDGFNHTHRLMLPRQSNDHIYWYAIAFSDGDSRDMREQLMAFVGPSFSTFRGERSSLKQEDPVESAIIDFAGTDPLVFRFQAGQDNKQWQQLAEALTLMFNICQNAEARPVELPRAIGRVLRDFYIALSAGNRDDAERALKYLRTNRLLDALNLQFMDVQLRSALGLWDEIIGLSNFSELVRVRRTRGVTRALIQAVYHSKHLDDFEMAKDVNGACRHFRDEIRPQFDELYRVRYGLTDSEVLKSFMLLAVTDTPQRPELRDELLSIPNIAATDLDYLNMLARLIPPTSQVGAATISVTTKVEEVARALEALRHGQFEEAMELVLRSKPSLERVKILLECSYELQTIASEQLVVTAVGQLSATDRDTLFQSRKFKNFWQAITKQPGEALPESVKDILPPNDWLEWLSRLSDITLSSDRMLDIASRGADEWSIESFVQITDISDRFINILNAATRDSNIARERLRDALPHLLRFLQKDVDYPRVTFRKMYESLRMEFAYSCEAGTASDFAVFGDLCGALLELGVDSAGYKSILDESKHLWLNFASPSNLRAMLDIVDRLVYFGCPVGEQSARSELAVGIFAKATPWVQSGRIDRENWRFLKQLATELALAEFIADVQLGGPAAEAEQEDLEEYDPLSSIAGLIVIHTLTEPAGLRVREILKQRSPQCKVEVNCDKVGSTHLKELARNADVFVLVTHSAKHAASTFIENHRKGRTILKPSGKGTSSILLELVKYATSGKE